MVVAGLCYWSAAALVGWRLLLVGCYLLECYSAGRLAAATCWPAADRLVDVMTPEVGSETENGGNNTENQENGLKNNGSSNGNGSNNGNDDGGGKPRLNLRWMDLLLDPDPDNIVAVGLTGLLTWASVSILWQLFVIALAILLAALKYSFIAALLIFILITLL
ncbi:hypothetical protein H5410_054998 [Solanum commersonii]|uniref:Uncharacterized protein n=1 Tax=Solanum commersonii TaxID=4109 RepID=A0A9J5WIP3_SOLCO|nr:hypothetical protein H5410_054998 [Solanum commersonii]